MLFQDSEMREVVHLGSREYGTFRSSEGCAVLEAGLAFHVDSGRYYAVLVFEANQGGLELARNPITHSNSMHNDVRHHFGRDFVGRTKISIILSQYQHGDFLTKVLTVESFDFHLHVVMNLSLLFISGFYEEDLTMFIPPSRGVVGS